MAQPLQSKFPKVVLRAALADDARWLEPFNERLMRPHVEKTHQWDNAVFAEHYQPELTSVIQIDGTDAGMLKVELMEKFLFLWDIQIAEEFQNLGIGTALVEDILDSAARAGLPVRLKVLRGKPAKRFYERLDFSVIKEWDNCFEMEWRSPKHRRKAKQK